MAENEQSKASQVIQKFQEIIGNDDSKFIADMQELKKNGRNYIGANALEDLYRLQGKEGIEKFIEWVIHPASGFLPQTHEAHSLADLFPFFDHEARFHNEQVDKNEDQVDKNNNPGTQTFFKRLFFKRKPIESSYAAAFSMRSPEKRDPDTTRTEASIQQRGISRMEKSEERTEEGMIVDLKRHNITRSVTIDELTRAAEKVLRNYLYPEIQPAKTPRLR